MTEKELIRAAMSLLGKRKSKAKTLAARRNAKKGGRPPLSANLLTYMTDQFVGGKRTFPKRRKKR